MEDKSKKDILKAVGIVGGAQVITIIIGVLKTKVVAVLLGPAGVGLIGVFQSTIDLLRQCTSFGINFSGVKEIAEASATNDQLRISKAITVLRHWAIYTGLFGMIIGILFCVPLSEFAFGDDKYALHIAIVSVLLLITSVSSAQLALLQGLREMGQMAKASIYGSIIGLILTLPLYWFWGVDAIIPTMILSGVISLVLSWKFARKIPVINIKLTFKETIVGGLSMARLGFFIVATSIIVTFTMYVIRSIVAKKMGIDAVGCFQAVYTITNLYMGLILNAMLADFFPRLSAINKDNVASNFLINEQLELAIVISGPMIVLLIAVAKLVIQILFSPEFLMAVPVLQWQLLGSFFAIISWAIGVMFLSKNKGNYGMIIEGVWSFVYFLFVYFQWERFGFNSLGIGFLIACIIRVLLAFIFTNKLGGFKFDKNTSKSILVYGFLVISVFINMFINEGFWQYGISSILVLISFLLSFRRISKIIDIIGFLKSKGLNVK